MITVQIEPFSIIEANKHLIAEHWDEVAGIDPTERKLDIDWDSFHAFDKSGQLVTIVARENGEVAGYAVFIIMRHLHAKGTLCAHNDALFLRKESRKGRVGIMLIKESKKILNFIFGDVLIMWHVKPHVDFSPILERIGYKKHETIYTMKASQ